MASLLPSKTSLTKIKDTIFCQFIITMIRYFNVLAFNKFDNLFECSAHNNILVSKARFCSDSNVNKELIFLVFNDLLVDFISVYRMRDVVNL